VAKLLLLKSSRLNKLPTVPLMQLPHVFAMREHESLLILAQTASVLFPQLTAFVRAVPTLTISAFLSWESEGLPNKFETK
jgi:hypothetical protein